MAGQDQMDEAWMALALEQAEEAARRDEVPIGAVLVRGESELARAHNAPIALCDPTAHAEVLALREAARNEQAYRLPGTTLYATIEPCSLCFGAALHARVSRIVYGATDPKGGAAGSVVDLRALPGVNHRIEVQGGILAAPAGDLLRRFFRARRGAD
ncbi:MAG: tRNA adenosine(34) deaminase TadA [Candidatus Binatia bacterium]|nr:tRNA adenosine(34) deaminase TadA [Candidatus Binatia bacterium]